MATVAKYAVPSAVVISALVIFIGAIGMDAGADSLYNFTQSLYAMPINDFAMQMSETAVAQWVVVRFYAIPIMQMVHIVAIAGTFIAVMMLAMEPFRLVSHAATRDIGRRYTKVLWWALLVVVASGVAMLFGDTVRNLLNSIFWMKMCLLVVGILTAIFYSSRLRAIGQSGAAASTGMKVTGVLLVVLWCLIMVCGRWIAYAPA